MLLLITNIDSINLEPITWASNFYIVVSRCFQGKVNFLNDFGARRSLNVLTAPIAAGSLVSILPGLPLFALLSPMILVRARFFKAGLR